MSKEKEQKLEEVEPQSPRNVEGGDHSWEYYVEGKLVHEDKFRETAHTSYFEV